MWLALAIAGLVAVSFAASVAARRASTEERPRYVTRGLDYLHARQADTGGFTTPSTTAWGILGAVASGERMGSSAWAIKGKNPFDYLQSISHESAATGADVNNAPVYYARAIMAYVAVDKRSKVFIAGTPHLDLLAALYAYQNWAETKPDPLPDTWGSFSPSSSTRQFDAVHTTCWAVLAMHSFGVDAEARFLQAETWLISQQKENGGFPSEASRSADVLTTGLAVQALTVAPDGALGPDVLPAARQFLKNSQNADGGFPVEPGGRTDAEATSAAIQAIVALGEHPEDAFWTVGAKTPISALGALQQENGSYRLTSRSGDRPLEVTSWALVAMRRRSFSVYPKSIGEAEKAFTFRPQFRSVAPRNGAKFTTTRNVLIRATYTDFSPKGTGIDPTATRVYVDGTNRSRPATIGNYSLRLLLKGVPDGTHTYKLQLVDHAGNAKVIERKFTVDTYVTPAPAPQPTYVPPVYPTVYPTSSHTDYPDSDDTITPTPYETYTPYPYDSVSPSPSGGGTTVTGSPVPSPSTSASPAGAGASGEGGSAAGFVGGTLLAMLPIGAALSYLVLQRREDTLDGASQGAILSGGGSAWDRFKHTLAKSKDLTRPSSRS